MLLVNETLPKITEMPPPSHELVLPLTVLPVNDTLAELVKMPPP